MDKNFEEIMVKKFFSKRLQERVLYELLSPKKRDRAIGRLSHSYRETLNEKLLVEILTPISNYKQIFNILKERGAD